jgi:hypothetical protein
LPSFIASLNNQQIKAAHHGHDFVESNQVADLYSLTLGPQLVPLISSTPTSFLAKATSFSAKVPFFVSASFDETIPNLFKIAFHVIGPSSPSAFKPKDFWAFFTKSDFPLNSI